jgi:hypothetical protein
VRRGFWRCVRNAEKNAASAIAPVRKNKSREITAELTTPKLEKPSRGGIQMSTPWG